MTENLHVGGKSNSKVEVKLCVFQVMIRNGYYPTLTPAIREVYFFEKSY